MRQEVTSSNDSFIHELRDTGTPEINLVSRLGMYKAREVDRYIKHLQDQLNGTTAVYQDRFEEMRTSLLGMTRERDEKINQIKDLEKKLSDLQDFDRILAERALVALPARELDQLRQDNLQLGQKVSQLVAQIEDNSEKKMLLDELQHAKDQLETREWTIRDMGQELAHAKAQLDEQQIVLADQQQKIEFLTDDRDKMLERFSALSESHSKLDSLCLSRGQEANQLRVNYETQMQRNQEILDELSALRERYKAKLEEVAALEQQLASQQQSANEKQLQLEKAQLQLSNYAEALAQSRTQNQMLEAQTQISQDLANRLMNEKSALEDQLYNQKLRLAAQRFELTNRFQGILNTQYEFLKKWQDNIATSVRYMENLAGTDLSRFLEMDHLTVPDDQDAEELQRTSVVNPENT